MTLSFPPFTHWVKRLMFACGGVFLLQIVLGAAAPDLGRALLGVGSLIPERVLHGWIWQLVSYSFLHAGLMHLLLNMLTLWMFGSQLESGWGGRRFLEYYFFCVGAAALTTVAASYLGFPGLNPATATVGASGGIYGLLAAFGLLYGERQIFMFPIPISMKAKYFVGILAFIVLASSFQASGVANVAHLGGMLFGVLYLKLLPPRGISSATSEKYFGLRNAWHRWKRRQAAKKFQVYMRKFDRDVRFDEHGNFIPPEKPPNGDDKSPWVN